MEQILQNTFTNAGLILILVFIIAIFREITKNDRKNI